jgi:hypothetical protein
MLVLCDYLQKYVSCSYLGPIFVLHDDDDGNVVRITTCFRLVRILKGTWFRPLYFV